MEAWGRVNEYTQLGTNYIFQTQVLDYLLRLDFAVTHQIICADLRMTT